MVCKGIQLKKILPACENHLPLAKYLGKVSAIISVMLLNSIQTESYKHSS